MAEKNVRLEILGANCVKGSRRERLGILVRLVRPRLTFGMFVAILAGAASISSLSFSNIVSSGFLALLGGFSIFGTNDYFDYETDKHNGRKGGLQGEIAEEEKRDFIGKTALVSTVSLLIFSVFLPFTSKVSVLAILGFSILYSVPPAKLKARPFLDSISNGFWIFFLFALGVGLAGGKFESVIKGAYWFSLFAAGSHAIGTLPDIEADKKAGISTIGTVLEWRGVISLNLLIVAAALYTVNWSSLTATFIGFWGAVLVLAFLKPSKQNLNRFYPYIYGVAVLYSLAWIIRKTIGTGIIE